MVSVHLGPSARLNVGLGMESSLGAWPGSATKSDGDSPAEWLELSLSKWIWRMALEAEPGS